MHLDIKTLKRTDEQRHMARSSEECEGRPALSGGLAAVRRNIGVDFLVMSMSKSAAVQPVLDSGFTVLLRYFSVDN